MKREEYDWIDDPFNEEKAAAEREQMRMTGCSRLGCLFAAIGIVVVLALLAFSVSQFFSAFLVASA